MCVLLDAYGMTGYEVCRRVKQNEATRDVPVIFISAASDLDERLEGFSLGAVDYIVKPYQREELLARVRTHVELARLRSRLDRLVSERTGELNGAIEQLRKNAEFQRQFLRDTLASVTDGVLILCHEEAELPAALARFGDPIAIGDPRDLSGVRECVRAAGDACGFSSDRCFELVNGVHEAAMNAIVHVGSGMVSLFADVSTGKVQVRVEDNGSGISLDHLPHATLKKGYTTAGTLGYGMKMILSMVDRLYLLTNVSGTIGVIEQGREKQDNPLFHFMGLDTLE